MDTSKVQALRRLNLHEIILLDDGIDKAAAFAIYGLSPGKDVDKQWLLEQVLKTMGVDVDELWCMCDIGYRFTRGSSPWWLGNGILDETDEAQ